MPVRRDWSCLNPACGLTFESDAAGPACPDCQCIKVRWCPSGGHIGSPQTKHADTTLRSVADRFGLSNLKSARQGEAAHPGVPQGKPIGDRMYRGIPWSDKPTAGFAPQQNPITISGPAPGRLGVKKKGPIPTNVRFNDPTAIKL